MKKKKKISIKFSPKKFTYKAQKKDADIMTFAVYCRVTYDRKSTRFPTSILSFHKDENEANTFVNEFNNDSHYLNIFIHSLITYEVENSNANYSIIGFKKRFNKYYNSLNVNALPITFFEILDSLSSTISHSDFTKIKSKLSNSYDYFLAKKTLEIFNEKSFDKEINTNYLNEMLAIYYLYCFDFYRLNDWQLESLYPVEKLVSQTKLGEWLINQNDLKNNIKNFCNGNDFGRIETLLFHDDVDKFKTKFNLNLPIPELLKIIDDLVKKVFTYDMD